MAALESKTGPVCLMRIALEEDRRGREIVREREREEGRRRERRRAVRNENETAKCWAVRCDLLQIDFCKLAPFFSPPSEMKGNDRGILITVFFFIICGDGACSYAHT